jgi:NTE family protein
VNGILFHITTLDRLQIRDIQKVQHETVLIMQGGGSLGAYECGVYKTLLKHNIEFDIIAGTSIGAVNAAIVAGSKTNNPASDLEHFWLTLADNITPSFLPDNIRSIYASMFAATYGNSNAFKPIWFSPYTIYDYSIYSPAFSSSSPAPLLSSIYAIPYLYDTVPLKKTLSKFVDFDKINNYEKYNSNSVSNIDSGKGMDGTIRTKRMPRLIVTCTDIQRSESVTFDSKHMKIDAEHIVACAGFPFYGIAWTEKEGRYLWDGSLLSNTPLREVIDASPKYDKKVYIVNLFPRYQQEVPHNIFDAWHRARDIIHTDKTDHNIRMSKVISRYLTLMRQMHDLLNNIQIEEDLRDLFFQIEREYHTLAGDRGTIIEEITKIERTEDIHFIFEDTDFSTATIKNLIKQGEEHAENVLSGKKNDNNNR